MAQRGFYFRGKRVAVLPRNLIEEPCPACDAPGPIYTPLMVCLRCWNETAAQDGRSAPGR